VYVRWNQTVWMDERDGKKSLRPEDPWSVPFKPVTFDESRHMKLEGVPWIEPETLA